LKAEFCCISAILNSFLFEAAAALQQQVIHEMIITIVDITMAAT